MWRFQVFRVRLWSVMWSKKACRSAQLTLTDKPFLFSEGQGRKKLPRCNHKRDALRLCCNLSGRELCFLCMPAVSRRKNQKDSKNTRSRCSSRRGIPQYGCGFDIPHNSAQSFPTRRSSDLFLMRSSKMSAAMRPMSAFGICTVVSEGSTTAD